MQTDEVLGLSDEECLVCTRIGPETFYRELREFGMGAKSARSVLKMLATIYFANPLLFVGKNKATVKAAVTYSTAVYLYLNNDLEYKIGEPPTQLDLVRLFGIANTISPRSRSSREKTEYPGFPSNIRFLFHEILASCRDKFPTALGGSWPDWVDTSVFRTTNKWFLPKRKEHLR